VPKDRKYRILSACAGFVLFLGLLLFLVVLFAPEDYYELQVDREGEGFVFPDTGILLFVPGTTVNLSAEPLADTNQGFVRWSGDAGGTDDAVKVTMDRHKKVTAVFGDEPAAGQEFKTLTIAVSGAGRGTTQPGPGMYRHLSGKEVLVQALPGEGGYFAGWQVIFPERELSVVPDFFHRYGLSMHEDVVLVARFHSRGYDVVLETEGSGIIVPGPGRYAVAEGVAMEVKAFPDPGHRLLHWDNGAGMVLQEPEDELNVHVLKIEGATGTCRAVFEKAERRIRVQRVTQGDAKGRVIPEAISENAEHSVAYGQIVELHALPENDRTAFAGWAGDLPADFSNTQYLSPKLNMIMTEDRDITANFMEAETKLAFEAVVDGTQDERATALLTPAPGVYGFVRNEAAGMELRAALVAGQPLAFERWEGDIPEGANPGDFKLYLPMDRNRRVTAQFVEREAHPMVLRHTGNGQGVTVPAPGRYAVSPGRILLLEAVPQQEGAFGGWRLRSADGRDTLSIENPMQWPVHQAVEIEAFFGRTRCAVSISATDEKAELRPPRGEYWLAKDADIFLEAVPPAGVYFHHWESSRGEIVSETPLAHFKIMGDEGYRAVFGPPFCALQLVTAGEGTGKVEADIGHLDRIEEGASVRLVAHAAPDAVFSHWEADFPDGRNETLPEITVVMDKSKEVTAHFDRADCQLTIMTTGLENTEKAVVQPGVGVTGYRGGSRVPLAAYPPEGGNIAFLGWKGDITSPNPEHTLVMDRSRQVTAVFGPAVRPGTAVLNLMPPAGTGRGRTHPLAPGKYSFKEDAEILLSFLLGEQDYFGGWSHDYEGDIRYFSLPVRMDGDKALGPKTAAAGSTLVLMLDTAEAGVTQPPPGVYRLAEGMKVTLNAVRTDDDYVFLGWHAPGGNLLSSSVRFTITVSSASPRMELIAVFRPYQAPPELVLCNDYGAIR